MATRVLPIGAQRAVATARRTRRQAAVRRAVVAPAMAVRKQVRVQPIKVNVVSAASLLLMGVGLLGLWYVLLFKARAAGVPDLPVLVPGTVVAGIVLLVVVARYFPHTGGILLVAVVLGMALLAGSTGLLSSTVPAGGTR